MTATPEQEWMAAWSPDGSAIAYGEASPAGGLWIVRREQDGSWGRPVKRLSSGGQWPAWSPDGRLLDRKGNASIWGIPAAGGTPRLLVRFDDPARPSYRTTWALGTKRIYFTIEDRQSDVWVVEIAPR